MIWWEDRKGETKMKKPKITIEKFRERLWLAKLDGKPLKIGTRKDRTLAAARFVVAFGNC
jgi:hypothetical protein